MKKIIIAITIIIGIVLLFWQSLGIDNNTRNKVSQKPFYKSQDKSKGTMLLPDLRASTPQQLFIQSSSDGRRIRFSTTFMNQGRGPLELIGRVDKKRNVTSATQVIDRIDGSKFEKQIGEFVYHQDHKHWHIENYTQFQIWDYEGSGKRGRLLASTDKMSFCIWDERAWDLTLENAPDNRKYIGCNSEVQGLSVGWSDTYGANLQGQEIDISTIKDGDYLIISVINPDRKIMESDYSNNEAILYVNVAGNSISVRNNP